MNQHHSNYDSSLRRPSQNKRRKMFPISVRAHPMPNKIPRNSYLTSPIDDRSPSHTPNRTRWTTPSNTSFDFSFFTHIHFIFGSFRCFSSKYIFTRDFAVLFTKNWYIYRINSLICTVWLKLFWPYLTLRCIFLELSTVLFKQALVEIVKCWHKMVNWNTSGCRS